MRLLRSVCHARHPRGVDEVSIRDLRNKGGEVVDRAARGELITITRDGKRDAELRPLTRPDLTARALVERWRHPPRWVRKR
jgi:prevent-host-death family protein